MLKNKVKAIFAGNSKRQHFRDLTDDMLTYGKQNVNLIFYFYWFSGPKGSCTGPSIGFEY